MKPSAQGNGQRRGRGFVRGLDNNSVFCAGYNVKWLRRIDDYAPSIIINGILVEDLFGSAACHTS